jgi:GT2 family glycosyltransferase
VKRTRSVHVTGIEPDAAAASRAVERLDHVHRKSAEDLSDRDFAGQKFDCIVFADVLEHLRNPTRVLKRCRNWLSDSGSVVISVPNSRHLSVVSGLVDGNWTYERAGLLDEDHVRCFTRRELEKLLFRCGYAVDEMKLAPGDGYSAWQQAGRPGEIHAGRFHIGGLTPVEAEEFYAYQYLVRAVPQAPPDFGLTSIVIVTWNQLQYTRQCVDSLLSRTDEPVELIFVDNGSADGTPEYLATIENATVIRNSENRGYAPAVNQGLQVCRGDQIVLLNNDCVVSTGWLHQLLSALHDDPRNGLVGPISNSVSGPQQVPVTYTDMASMDGFAWDCRHDRRLQETDRLVGFCLLFRREVLERIGDLDERFEVGCFEDDDFCRRASGAGYRVLIAPNAFVHHYGSATFRGAGLDFAEIMRANEQRYAEKWSDSTEREISAGEITSDLPAVEYVAHELDNGERLLQRKHVVVSCV